MGIGHTVWNLIIPWTYKNTFLLKNTSLDGLSQVCLALRGRDLRSRFLWLLWSCCLVGAAGSKSTCVELGTGVKQFRKLDTWVPCSSSPSVGVSGTFCGPAAGLFNQSPEEIIFTSYGRAMTLLFEG